MREKIKAYCEDEFRTCLIHHSNVEKAVDRCYGAVMFFINYMTPEFDEEIAKWWDDEMHPKFRELERR